MKAIVQTRYGPVEALRLGEIPKPAAGDGEVLIRVRAASVHPDVWHVVTGRPYLLRLMGSGLRRPRQPVPGTDVAGEVAAVGPGVTGFSPGDLVFGETIKGYSWVNGGAFAEFVRAPAETLAHKPANVDFAQAAAVPTTGYIAMLNLRVRARPEPGRRVLVNGAGGGVGTIVVQIAKAYGAEVTGVDSTAKLAMLRSLGADHVIDYTRQDFTDGDQRYDLIVDIPGNHPFRRCRRVLTPGGTYVLIAHDHFGTAGRRVFGSVPRFFGLAARSVFTRALRTGAGSPPPKREVMPVLRELLENGQLTPVIDRSFPLAETADAIRYLASGRAVGKVVVTV